MLLAKHPMSAVTERLVDLAREIRFDNLPAEVTREAGRRLLDALGCMIAGADGVTTQQVRKTALALAGAPESSILGTDYSTSCEKAALVNGTSLRFLDFMDGHPGPYPCHPCFNIPPILAVAERVRATGKDLVTAIVTGYEIMPRFQENAGAPDLGSRGWAGSTNLAFSIPLACAHLLKLNREETINALGISVTHGGVMDGASHGQMPTSKSLLDGIVAMNAIVAALLAQQGVTGPREVIEGTAGYVNAVAGQCDTDGLLAPVGKHKILETYTKLYNTVKCGQPAVGAALKLVREHRINWRDIVSLKIGFARRDANTQARESYARPQSRDTANHSVRFGVAAALVDGQLTADQFNPEKLCSPDILSLVDRSSVWWNEALEAHWPKANPATIIMMTTDGQEWSETMVFPPGHPNNPLADDALEQKFRQLTGRILDSEQIEKVIELTRRLDLLADVRALTNILRPQREKKN
jgi:2-methylcitrate dehydratase